MNRQLSATNSYTDKLLKLVPAEFVSLYLAAKTPIPDDSFLLQPILLSTALVLAVLIPVYLHRVHKVTDKLQIAMTTTAFLVWTYTLGDAYEPGQWIPYDLYVPEIASVALLFSTGLPPLFLQAKGEPE